ncbi:MAG: type II secretion system GspH family protein [Puniceicoccales bacterium]|jgi:prepilin-type N-terminal cleavage/methylation domain-containing protein|nr:type II secretion system GspH family protein [Puniceicoccales bacterium]
MKTTHKNHRRGFTLVELLAVITILGILIAVMVPNIQNAMRGAKQSAALNSLRNIVMAFTNYSSNSGIITEGTDPKKGEANDVAGVAEILASYANSLEAAPWYIDSDKKLESEIPAQVLENGKSGTNKLRNVKPIAWAVVLNAKKSKIRDSNYPLLWTRGLKSDGTWDEDNSPWGSEGGHIAFGDAHVKWYINLTGKQQLIHYETGKETSNYQDAIGTGNTKRIEDTL